MAANVVDSTPPKVPAAAVIAELQRYAAFVGLVLTARCRHCGRPLFAARSIQDRTGPACRAAHAEVRRG